MPSSLTPEQWHSILELQGHERCPGVAIEFGRVLRTSGDFRQTATLFRPESPGPRRLPAILAMHGGGFTSGNPDGVGMWAKYFAIALGLTTVSVSYRLGTPDRPTFPLPIGDGMDGLRWIRANAQALGVNGERCFLVGDSAGACLCAMLAVLPGSPAAGDLARLGDLAGPLPPVAGLMSLWGPMDFVARWFDNGGRPGAEPNLIGCNYPDNPALYHRASPITYIRPGLPPAIFVYGNQDAVVHPRQGALASAAWQAAGNRSELLMLDHIGHGIAGDSRPSHRQMLLRLGEFVEPLLSNLTS
jgi:acetyl esterase/lipase